MNGLGVNSKERSCSILTISLRKSKYEDATQKFPLFGPSSYLCSILNLHRYEKYKFNQTFLPGPWFGDFLFYALLETFLKIEIHLRSYNMIIL